MLIQKYGYYILQIVFCCLFVGVIYLILPHVLKQNTSYYASLLSHTLVIEAKPLPHLTTSSEVLPAIVSPIGPVASYVRSQHIVKEVQPTLIKTANKKDQTQSVHEHQPTIFLYTTHNRESFLPHLNQSKPELAFSETINVQQLLPGFENYLSQAGFKVYRDETDIQTILKKENLTYQKSYDVSRRALEKIIQEVPNLTYSFDIHRDSNRRQVTTVSIDDVSYAKLLFVIGKDHLDFEKNKIFARQLSDALNTKYPGISRGVKLLGGSGRNGIYNQDIVATSVLIEVGGVDNTMEEAERSLEKIAECLSVLH